MKVGFLELSEEKLKERSDKASATLKAQRQGKTYEEIYGAEKAKEISQKNSGALKKLYKEGKKISPMKNPDTVKKVAETMRRLIKEGKLITPLMRKRYWPHPKGMLGKHQSEETKKKMRDSHAKIKEKMGLCRTQLWQNPEYREKQLKLILKGLFKRPTSLEQKMIGIIQKYNLPYKYTGDGSLLIGYKNPDFVNTNGEKICIEVRPKETCNFWNKCTPEEYEQKRKEHFAKYGWKCVVIWEEDINNPNIISRIGEKYDG